MGLDGVRCQAHRLENIDENGPANWMPASVPPPETPTESMEFLARSWSVSATELTRALSTTHVAPKNFEETTFGFLGDENAQVHAAVSVAGVAAAVAALTASNATLAEMSAEQQKGPSKTPAAIASAAALVASHCIEIAEEMGADHDQILTAVNSAINARSNGDVMTLTAAAATGITILIPSLAILKCSTKGSCHLEGKAAERVWSSSISPRRAG